MTDQSASEEHNSNLQGRLLARRFEVLEEISQGAFGRVFKVSVAGLDKVLAAKVVAQEGNSEAFKRLVREGQVLCRLRHPNIVQVHSAALDDQEGYVVVMDFLQGVPLSDLLSDRNGLPSALAEKLALDICRGLQAAHEQGILHRDLKPNNIMIVGEGDEQRAVLIDFGISKVEQSSQKLTTTGEVLGTPLYMSPEQFTKESLTPGSDIYSFGCVLYEMLTGTPPFKGDSAIHLAYKHENLAPVQPSVINKKVNPRLEAVALRCLEKKPADRFATIKDVDNAIANDTIALDTICRRPKFKAKQILAVGGIVAVLVVVAGTTVLCASKVYDVRLNKAAAIVDKALAIQDEALLKPAEEAVDSLLAANKLNADNLKTADLWAKKASILRMQARYNAAAAAARKAIDLSLDQNELAQLEAGIADLRRGNPGTCAHVLHGYLRKQTQSVPVRIEMYKHTAQGFLFTENTRSKRDLKDASSNADNALTGELVKAEAHPNSLRTKANVLSFILIRAEAFNRMGKWVPDNAGDTASADMELQRAAPILNAVRGLPEWPLLQVRYDEAQAEYLAGIGQIKESEPYVRKVMQVNPKDLPAKNPDEAYANRQWIEWLRARLKKLQLAQ